jgi:hypothetical protein
LKGREHGQRCFDVQHDHLRVRREIPHDVGEQIPFDLRQSQ